MKLTPNKYRTHTCSELRQKNVGERVTLSGWVQNRRDHGGLIFIDLRDKTGLTQIVFDPEISAEAHTAAEHVRSEWCLKITGKVRARLDGMANPKLKTGEIEVEVHDLEILNQSHTPPFEIEDDSQTNEELRLTYRYLDMRRRPIQEMLQLRADLIFFMREWMRGEGFCEVQTPILANSSPEGARDFLVPSRLHPGKFYALPQAPQQFKQLLMCGGVDKYFQVAPCFRDEDARADRHVGDFYQLDIEMSFVEQDDVMDVCERLYDEVTEKFGAGKKRGYGFAPRDFILNAKGEKWSAGDGWPRIAYNDALTHFGSDKPDLRFDMCIENVEEELAGTSFGVFAGAIDDKEKVIHALCAPEGASKLTRKDIDKLTELAMEHHAKGLAWWKVGEDAGPVAKNVEADKLEKVKNKLGAKEGDLIFFGADTWHVVCNALGAVRKELGQNLLQLADKNLLAWAWIHSMPFYERGDDGKLDFGHNPFSMPIGGLPALDEQHPESIRAYQYDFVCNGYECCSGAIRNHDPRILQRAFEIVGHQPEVIDREFGHLARAFEYGAPPHGGAAPGIDRLMMLLLDTDNIRDIYAFPKTSTGMDLMMQSPSEVDENLLRDLGLKKQVKMGE